MKSNGREVTDRGDAHSALQHALSVASVVGAVGPKPGIVVLNHTLDCLFANPEADRLIRDLHRTEGNHRAMSRLPRELGQLCQDLVMVLKKYPDPRTWGRVQVTRVLGASAPVMLARLHGIPASPQQPDHYLILGLLEQTGSRHEGDTSAAQATFGLSHREQACLVHLLQGMTNKEIAAQLGISEYTVKEHFKRIMLKTGATTRTGVLVRVLGHARVSMTQEKGRAFVSGANGSAKSTLPSS
ncbi:MAG: helix-turn-helix transcriptional regulator [Nitrospirota bacterium]